MPKSETKANPKASSKAKPKAKPKSTPKAKPKTAPKGAPKAKATTPKKTAKAGSAPSSKKKTVKKDTKKTKPKSKPQLKSLRKRVKQAKKPKVTRRKQTEQRKRAKIRNGILRRQKLAARRAKAHSKFQIRCKKPVDDEIFDVDEFVKYLVERFKVNGKTGMVGQGKDSTIQKAGTTVHILSKQPFPKYYIKFLTKRYLKRNLLRDYVRVIADKKGSYELRYFNIQEEKDKAKKQD